MSSLLTLVSVSGLADLVLKSAAVMLLTAGASALMRRASAAWRHLTWCLGVVSLLLLPALSLTLPAWRVTWLPQWSVEPNSLRSESVESGPNSGLRDLEQTNPPVKQQPPVIFVPPSVVSSTTEDASALLVANTKTAPAPGAWPLLTIAWGTGALLSLVPLAVGLWKLAALHRRSQVIDDRRWLILLAELRRQLAVRRSVQLRQCEAALAPLTFGALRPVLLVPAESSNWSDERRRLVLLHELAHVRRWDWLTQLLAHIACALYWFNPLVWLAARQMRVERERASDDLVLACGARASDYAQELLALAAGLSKSQLSTLVAVPMARRGMLEDRLRGILDSRRSRIELTTAAVCLAAAFAAIAIAPLAMLRAASPESAEAKTDEPVQVPPVKEKPAAEKPAEPAAPPKDPVQGKEATARIEQFPPSFSKAQEGIETGLAIPSDRKAFHTGERVPLDFVIRNVSEKTLIIEHSLYPPETPPTVIDAEGKQLSIEMVVLLGANRRYRDTLKPNDAAIYRHLGLGLGENPNPGTFWNPFLNEAVPGTYRLSQQAHVTVREEGQDAGTSFRGVSGEVAFEIETAEPKKKAEKPAEEQAEKPKPVPAVATVQGKVVDDDTGKPIELPLITQSGKFDPADPKKVTWGYSEGRSSARDGSFSAQIRWTEGWTARILVDGYIPQPVITAAPDKEVIDVTIRLKRGPKVRGAVLDHTGKPLKDASVFSVGPSGLNLGAGGSENNEGNPSRTDAEGRFELFAGEAKFVAVSHAAFDAWPAPIPEKGDFTIRLPEPAQVEVELNVAGAEKESVVFYQLLTSHLPEFLNARVRSERSITVKNPGKLTLAGLPPGKYQICRSVTNGLEQIGFGAMLDRQFFEVKSGETKSIDFTREKGARVRGKITRPADTKLSGIIVKIQDLEAHKSPFDEHVWTTVYASQTAEADGSFLTERVPPGKYALVASAYVPLTPEQMVRSGFIGPSFQAGTTIEVPELGELKVGDLALKPIKSGE